MRHLKKFEEMDFHTIGQALHNLALWNWDIPGIIKYGVISLGLSIFGSYTKYKSNRNRIHSEVSKIERHGEDINIMDGNGNVILIFNPTKRTLQVIPDRIEDGIIDNLLLKPIKLSDKDFKKFSNGVVFLEKIQNEIPEILQEARDNGVNVDISNIDVSEGDFFITLKNPSGSSDLVVDDMIDEMVERIEGMIGVNLELPTNATTSITKHIFGSKVRPYRKISKNNCFIKRQGDELKYCDIDGREISNLPKDPSEEERRGGPRVPGFGLLIRTAQNSQLVVYLYFKKRS